MKNKPFLITILIFCAASTSKYASEEQKGDTRKEKSASQSSTLLEWQSRIALRDSKAALICLDTLMKANPNPLSWTIDEISLASFTWRLSLQIGKLQELYQTIQRAQNREQPEKIILEQCSWALLDQGIQSHHPRVRFEALLGALRSSDAQSIPLLCRSLYDQNLPLRNFALEIAEHFPDIEVQEALLHIARDGNKEERIKAMRTLLNQGAINAFSLTEKALQEPIWNIEEKATLRVLLAINQPGVAATHFSGDVFKSLVSSNTLDGKLAALEYASQFVDKEIPSLIIRSSLLNEEHYSLRLKALEILGAHSFLFSSDEKELVMKVAYESLQSPVQLLQARSAWILALISDNNSEKLETSHQWLLNAVHTKRDPALQEIAIAHIRALGSRGKDLIEAVSQGISRGQIALPYESQMTLGIYMIEQRFMIDQAISYIQSGLQKSRGTYIYEKNSTSAFSCITKNHEESPYYYPQMKASIDLYTRLNLLLMISQASENKISSEEILSLIQGSDCLGTEFQMIQLLHGELKIPLNQVQDIISAQSTEKKIYTALTIAYLSHEEASIHLIQEILSNEKELTNDEIDMILSCLSMFPLEKTQQMIAPFLMDEKSPLSIRIKASASFLSSLAQ